MWYQKLNLYDLELTCMRSIYSKHPILPILKNRPRNIEIMSRKGLEKSRFVREMLLLLVFRRYMVTSSSILKKGLNLTCVNVISWFSCGVKKNLPLERSVRIPRVQKCHWSNLLVILSCFGHFSPPLVL